MKSLMLMTGLMQNHWKQEVSFPVLPARAGCAALADFSPQACRQSRRAGWVLLFVTRGRERRPEVQKALRQLAPPELLQRAQRRVRVQEVLRRVRAALLARVLLARVQVPREGRQALARRTSGLRAVLGLAAVHSTRSVQSQPPA